MLTEEKKYRMLTACQVIMDACNMIEHAYQEDLVDSPFKSPTLNQKRKRILSDVTDIKAELYRRIKPVESHEEVDIEHPYQLTRAMKFFSLMSTAQLTEFMDKAESKNGL